MLDKNDASFDLMARQLGTHIIRDPALLWEYQADVTQMIAHSEVTFAATLSDGTILLCCPRGLPEDLASFAEPFKAPPPTPSLEAKLALIERKLDGMLADQVEREQMRDRLDAVEFALQERLASEPETGPSPEEAAAMLQDLIQKHDDLASTLAQKMESDLLAQSIAGLEDRVMAALQTPTGPDLSSVVAVIQASTAHLQAAPADTLAALMAKVEALAARPAPVLDLTAQHQAFTSFLTSLGTETARLEQTIDLLGKMQERDFSPQISDIKSIFDDLLARLEAGPDWSPVLDRLDALQAMIAQGRDDGATADAFPDLIAKITHLAERPAPVLDLTAQRQSFAAFANAMSRAIERLEAVSEALMAPVEPVVSLPQLDTLAGGFDRVLVQNDQTASALQHLAQQISGLAQRPDPILDLTAQRQSFAAFGQALSKVVTRLEGVSDLLETRQTGPQPEILAKLDRIEAGLTPKDAKVEDRRDLLVDALLQLANHLPRQTTVARPTEPDDRMILVRVAQEELLQDLRFAFAELVATQLRNQSHAA